MSNTLEYKICSIEDCTGKHVGLGYCNKHYRRLKKTGSTEGPSRRKSNMSDEELIQFILNNIEIVEGSNCWIWQKEINDNGYGKTSFNGKDCRVHRVLYILTVDPNLPDSTVLDHKECVSRACCNPEHMRPCAQKQNSSHRHVLNSSNTTGHRNISYYKGRKNPYMVTIRKNRKTHYFGCYSSIEEANKVAIEKRKELFGEFSGTI